MVNQWFGMILYPNGEIYLLMDETVYKTPWSNLPTDQPLYGVVGLENDGDQDRKAELQIIGHCKVVIIVCLFVCLSACLLVCLPVYLFLFVCCLFFNFICFILFL